jgi:hypothetical protein
VVSNDKDLRKESVTIEQEQRKRIESIGYFKNRPIMIKKLLNEKRGTKEAKSYPVNTTTHQETCEESLDTLTPASLHSKPI